MPALNKFLFLLLVTVSGSAIAQVHRNWNLEFPTSQSGPAQEHFLDGVTYMHLHMFEDAEEAFARARELAPDFVMAYWAGALNFHRPIWSIYRRDEARALLGKLGATPEQRIARAPTPRERAYMTAIEALFGPGSLEQRQLAYSAKMQEVVEQYPEDIEAKAFYALSLMRITPPDMTRQQTRSLMAGTALQVLAANPRHPGANRYLIQSTDDPENTDLGLIAVNNLVGIDTDAAEALHIPSHYYLQHGMWRQVAESNMEAFRASMTWVEDHGWSLQDLNAHNYGHLLQFANYGYLQSGALDAAAELRERVRRDYVASGLAAEIEVPFADLLGRWLLDLQQWQEAANLAAIADEYDIRNPGLWQAIGIGAARSGDLALANRAVQVLDSLGSNPAGQGPISARTVEGLIHLAQGRRDSALEILGAATLLNWEQPVTLIGVPPRPLKPPMEVYGEALLASGEAEAALAQFQLGLTRYRGRTNLLLGAAGAAEALGQSGLANRYYRQLAQAWADAAADHPLKSAIAARLR